MQLPPEALSVIGKGIRARARRNRLSYLEATGRILFHEQSTFHAIEVAMERYEANENPALLAMIGDLHVVAGERVIAQNIFKSLFYQGHKLHVTNLIYAGLSATTALVDDKKKMLFIPIPKCGSSTVKNYFTTALFGEYFGERVHFQHQELYRIITKEEMSTTYRNYYKFSVSRDPISRLVSYFMTNISGGSLAREAYGGKTFFDLPTRPGPAQLRQGFHSYVQLFKDFRHHTDPMCGFLDPFRKDLDKIYTMSELGELRNRMAKTYKCDLSDERAMVSKTDQELKERSAEIFAPLKSHYEQDYKRYL